MLISGLAGKRATGKLFLLDMWHLVKETATDCGPLIQSRNSNDVAELKLIAAEIVNILFQDCRENIRIFTMSFHFYTELYDREREQRVRECALLTFFTFLTGKQFFRY